ncbi:hypothetical protein [Shewanella sp. Isolate11]|uniref:hypothetical protein n=1 Tax=Shewanella sp. Isolate11 TaxID=2908530 RepID=UPI001EFC9EFE|nr:hypothetical protein [Shewanella sp. Isolate11]MCG9698215.1 hypothetical protein [Shewanella sp. Isolate11]
MIALLLIAIVTLQFAGANFGAHQLHLDSHEQQSDNHPHLLFSTQVVSFEQCVDCQCGFDTLIEAPAHQHQISKTETQNFELCLDCQCHGGHVTMLSQPMFEAVIPDDDQPSNLGWHYLPPEHQPSYRPPIA